MAHLISLFSLPHPFPQLCEPAGGGGGEVGGEGVGEGCEGRGFAELLGVDDDDVIAREVALE